MEHTCYTAGIAVKQVVHSSSQVEEVFICWCVRGRKLTATNCTAFMHACQKPHWYTPGTISTVKLWAGLARITCYWAYKDFWWIPTHACKFYLVKLCQNSALLQRQEQPEIQTPWFLLQLPVYDVFLKPSRPGREKWEERTCLTKQVNVFV